MTVNAMDLTGKRILVTGASSGIGKSTAKLLAQLGAAVILLARNAERLHEIKESLEGTGHSYYSFDLADVDDIPALIKNIAQQEGPLSGLCHAAGIASVMPVNLLKKKYIESVFDVSIKAALILAKGFCPKDVRYHGSTSLVFMSSAAAVCGVPGMSIYSASKAAIDGAVRSLACELASRAIRVNSIIAGAVKTEMHEELVKKLTQEEISAYEQKHLLGFGNPEDIAYVVAFLLSDASKWITGTSILVDGGYCCP